MSRRPPFSVMVAGTFMIAMLGANGLAAVLRPSVYVADSAPKINLESLVPQRFGEWREETVVVAQVVNPQQEEMLTRIYSQILTRNYVNAAGQRIMLSIAYGGDQTDGMQVHEPEVCYPAQGFQLQKSEAGLMQTAFGDIPVRRLVANLGSRYEPVTYWVTIADRAVRPGPDKKIAELKYGLRGQIPDGLLFRVSSLDRNETAAFSVQDSFVRQLLEAIPATSRKRLSGLGGA